MELMSASSKETSLRATINEFVEKLYAANAQPISVPFVTESIIASMPHVEMFTDIERTAVYIGTAQTAREVMRARHDDDYDRKRIGQRVLDFPESALLNEGYSVLRNSDPVYVPRMQMTRDDMEYVCGKFDGLSSHFARASRALRAEFERRNASAA